MPLIKKTARYPFENCTYSRILIFIFYTKSVQYPRIFFNFATNFPNSSSTSYIRLFPLFGGIFYPFHPDSCILNQFLNTEKHCLMEKIALYYLATGQIRISQIVSRM